MEILNSICYAIKLYNVAEIFLISFNRFKNDLSRFAESRLYFICNESKGAASIPKAFSMSNAISALRVPIVFESPDKKQIDEKQNK